MRREVVILGAPLESESYSGMALFKAPEFMPYEEDYPVDQYLMDELWPRIKKGRGQGRGQVWTISVQRRSDGKRSAGMCLAAALLRRWIIDYGAARPQELWRFR